MLPTITFEQITKPVQNSIKLKIKKPQVKRQGVQLSQQGKQILQSNFVILVIGKPGSGKSHLINQLINDQKFYGKRFQRIIYLGPTRYKNVIHDKFNTKTQIDVQWIYKHAQMAQGWCKNMLVVMDDVISQIPSQQKNGLQQLIYNRRHIIKGGCISFIITTQKYFVCPAWLRTCITSMFTFKLGKSQIKQIFQQSTLQRDKRILQTLNNKLQDHSFLFINLQKGKIYNQYFIQI